MDTKYFQQALEAWSRDNPQSAGSPLNAFMLSEILRRAQALKEADKPPANYTLDRMGA